ncbi:MAG: hypothetical protein ABSE95_06925 [Thermodesulfobacteriota bacterium]|jgi:hypothetical protein
MSEDIQIKDGYFLGGWRRPVNVWINLPGSIHNDEVAQKVGMRGGTIPGTIHLNLFPPLLLQAFGQRWFEQGTLSAFYTYATTDREEVRAVLGAPPTEVKEVQVEARAETPDGHTVLKGTASVGNPKEPSYLQTLEFKNAKPEELRILAGLKAGSDLAAEDVLITQELVDASLKTITDPLDWYRDRSPWGSAIVPPAGMAKVMMIPPVREDGKTFEKPKAVGFYGATELHNINGPVKIGVSYRAKGKLICVGASSKTEFIWYDVTLDEKDSGKRVAEMRQMTRWMKSSIAG